MFNRYQSGDWYFIRDAKSGSTSVRCANLMTLENGTPQVIQSYRPTVSAIDAKVPSAARDPLRQRTADPSPLPRLRISGIKKTISLNRSATANPTSAPAANG